MEIEVLSGSRQRRAGSREDSDGQETLEAGLAVSLVPRRHEFS
jgi:hypothetical protein